MDTLVHPDSRRDVDVLLDLVVNDPVWFEEALTEVAAALAEGPPMPPDIATTTGGDNPNDRRTYGCFIEQRPATRWSLGADWCTRSARSPPCLVAGSSTR